MLYAKGHKLSKHQINNRWLILGIVVIFYQALFNGAIFAIFDRFGWLGKSAVDIGLFIVESAIIVAGLFVALQRAPVLTISLYAGIASLFIITACFYIENSPTILSYCKSTFVFCIPACVFAYCLQDKGAILDAIKKWAKIAIIAGCIYVLFANIPTYSMWMGYQLLLPLMLLVRIIYRGKQKWWDYVLLFCGGYLVVIKGSRGPVLILTVYIAVMHLVCLWESRKQIRKNMRTGIYSFTDINRYIGLMVIMIIAATLIFAVLINFSAIATYAYEYLLTKGIESRSLAVFSKGGLFYLSSRDMLLEVAIKGILERPLLGYGVGGDCVYLGREVFGTLPSESTGSYVHNILIELCMHYGALLGVIVFGIFVFCVFKAWKRVVVDEQRLKDLFYLVAIYASIFSFLSATYMKASILWLLLGLSLPRRPQQKTLETFYKLERL